jgi:hypothetical protein
MALFDQSDQLLRQFIGQLQIASCLRQLAQVAPLPLCQSLRREA